MYLTENSPELMTLEQHGLLAKLAPVDTRPGSRALHSPTGDWVGIALRVSALAYDPALVPARSSRSRSSTSRSRSGRARIAIAPTDSDFPPLVGAVIAAYGKQAAVNWLAGLKRNAQLYQDDECGRRGRQPRRRRHRDHQPVLLVSACGSRSAQRAMHSALYYFPNHDVGSIENISGAAVLASSKHHKRLQAFVNFLVSPPRSGSSPAATTSNTRRGPGIPPEPAASRR